jgi:S1-C subfamily serine protease
MIRPIRPRHPSLLLLAALLSTPRALAGQDAPRSEATSLEALAQSATRAVVLIDVQTPSDSRQGSGFIVDPSGLILTNYHVVRDARAARVKLASGDVYDRVSILAQDERRDLAVLQVAGYDLPTLPLGNSDSVRIGSSVVHIGSPLGLENTVSTGIVSGRRQEPAGFQLLQISAPASPGSSGGAVMSASGEVIAIAASQQAGGQNLNFAVPINYARGLLQAVGRESPVVLQPGGERVAEATVQPLASNDRVNVGLSFDAARLRGYVVEARVELGGGRQRLTRIAYRVIETVGGAPPRIERYLESQTTQRTEPFETWQTVRRERVRSLVALDGLRPISSRGEVATWTDGGWQEAQHDVRFEGDRVVGVVTDTTGRGLELDRVLPRGILLRDMRDVAFGLLVADSLVGRSVEFATFDPRTGEVTGDRYDVLESDTLTVAGETRSVLRVNVASGLTNETVYFESQPPRVVTRRVSQDGSIVEDVTSLEMLGSVRP